MELRKSCPVHPLGFMVSGIITLQIIQIINAGLCYWTVGSLLENQFIKWVYIVSFVFYPAMAS